MATKASTTGAPSLSWQELRIAGPRTLHAARSPRWPCPSAVATLASPSRRLRASGVANGGIALPGATPRGTDPTLPRVLMLM